MQVGERIDAHRGWLTPTERRIAEVVLADPEAVAFGTVAGVAEQAGTSGASVVRLAAKLGFDGFVELQSAVQAELARRLRPASERIRQPPTPDVVGRTVAVELDNVQSTLDGIQPGAFATAVRFLSARGNHVHVLSGEASGGIARMFADQLGMLRPGVELLGGSEVRVARSLADLERGSVLVVIDIRRYDRWVLATAERAQAKGAIVLAITDSALSPLAALSKASFTVSAVGAGPFDSHVGTLALVNALVTGVSGRLRTSATDRLDRVESAWQEAGALVDL